MTATQCTDLLLIEADVFEAVARLEQARSALLALSRGASANVFALTTAATAVILADAADQARNGLLCLNGHLDRAHAEQEALTASEAPF